MFREPQPAFHKERRINLLYSLWLGSDVTFLSRFLKDRRINPRQRPGGRGGDTKQVDYLAINNDEVAAGPSMLSTRSE